MKAIPASMKAAAAVLFFCVPGSALALSFETAVLDFDLRVMDAAVVESPKAPGGRFFCVFLLDLGDSPRKAALFSGKGLERLSTLEVPADAVLFDVGDVLAGPGQEILYLCPEGVRAQVLNEKGSGAAATLALEARTFFDGPQEGSLQRFGFCRDVNADGAADLLVPQQSGWLVNLRGKNPSMQALSIAPRNRMSRVAHEMFAMHFSAQRFSLPTLEELDFDGDGRKDLLCLSDHHLLIFLQGEKGFQAEPSWRMPLRFMEGGGAEPEEDAFEGRRLFAEDVNGDGLADLIVARTQGKVGLFSSIRTRFELFLGRKGEFFPKVPDRLLTVPGVGVQPEFTDLEGDGKLDLVVPSLRTDVLSGIKTAVASSFSVTYYLFACDRSGLWEETPAFEDTVSMETALLEKGESVPGAFFTGDFDGDGRKDRIAFDREEMRIHRGLPGTKYDFSREPAWTARAAVSNDLVIEDVNGDGLPDAVFFHPMKVVLVLSKK